MQKDEEEAALYTFKIGKSNIFHIKLKALEVFYYSYQGNQRG